MSAARFSLGIAKALTPSCFARASARAKLQRDAKSSSSGNGSLPKIWTLLDLLENLQIDFAEHGRNFGFHFNDLWFIIRRRILHL